MTRIMNIVSSFKKDNPEITFEVANTFDETVKKIRIYENGNVITFRVKKWWYDQDITLKIQQSINELRR